MIIDEFHFIFDKCKRKIEFYMSYYNGTEFISILTVIVDNIIKEQNNIANKEKENAKNEI